MNKQIEELALKVAQQRYVEQHSGTGEGINFSNYAEFAKSFLAELAKQSEPLTDSFVQTVPDKCDRIIWRNAYYHLPLPQSDLVAEVERLKGEAVVSGVELHSLKFTNADLLKKNNALSNTAHCLERQLSAAQADNEQLVKALEVLPTVLIAEQPEWDMYENNGTIWKLFLTRYCDEAIAAHKARQGKEES